MKNKYQRINEYFNLIKDILVQNPNIDINNSLYSLLVSQNTKSKTTLNRLGIYDNWKRRFKNANINTSDNDSYIEFSKSSNLSQKNYIFLHTPIDHEHIENSINILIDFLINSPLFSFIFESKLRQSFIHSTAIKINIKSTTLLNNGTLPTKVVIPITIKIIANNKLLYS